MSSTYQRVGVLGGGQLGQMLALSGYPIGIETICFDSAVDVPAALVGTVVAGDINNIEALHQWTSKVDVITYEWENFPAELVADLSEIKDVRPGPNALAIAQDRWAEKRLFSELEIPVTPFRIIQNNQQLKSALSELETPLVVKTRTGGYDGKGQVVVSSENDIEQIERAHELIAENECVAEQWVRFDAEVSIIGVRGLNGDVAIYPITQNEHRNGILHSSIPLTQIDDKIVNLAEKYMGALLSKLNYVGVLALETFMIADHLIANEMAPRVHNSGHWTIEGAQTSQFENHLRAITGLPLGNTALRSPTAMVNLIGTVPKVEDLLAIPGLHLHLYGKEPRPRRKLGHLTITANTTDDLNDTLGRLNETLISSGITAGQIYI